MTLPVAKTLIAALACAALLLPLLLQAWQVAAIVMAYLTLNIAYTLSLKHEVLVDVFCIVAGFMLRIICGTYAVGITPSRWLLLCSFMLTLFLGFTKRRAEFVTTPNIAAQPVGSTRLVLRMYSPQLLDILVAVTASTTLLTYGLYTVDADTVAQQGTQNLVFTLPIVTFGIFRYLYLLYAQGSGEDPGKDLLGDPQIRIAVAAWVVLVLCLIGGV